MDENYSPIDMNQNTFENTTSLDMSKLLQRVFFMMTGGLLITAVASYITLSVSQILVFVINTMWIWLIAELLVVIFLSARINKIGSGTAIASFVVYSIINGVTLTPIFLVYTLSSIGTVFLIAAGMFAGAAIVGKTTKMDLTKVGSYLMMALIGLIIASIVNIFVGNTMLDFIISVVGIIIFIGLTAYDVQKIKNYASEMSGTEDEMIKKLTVVGALSLYLDFINIFLKLLSVLGKRRD